VKRRRIFWSAGVVVVAVVASALLWPREREPVYQGKKLSEWLKEYEPLGLSGGMVKRPDTAAADDAIRHMGTNALPWLVRWVEYEVPAWRLRVDGLLEKVPLTGLRGRVAKDRNNEVRVRNRGALGLRLLGPEAKSALPRLARYVSSYRGWTYGAMRAMSFIGHEGFCQVTNLLSHPDRNVRVTAVAVLGNEGERSREAVGPLSDALNDVDFGVRQRATNALLQVAPELFSEHYYWK
jgi:hypothetical protein